MPWSHQLHACALFNCLVTWFWLCILAAALIAFYIGSDLTAEVTLQGSLNSENLSDVIFPIFSPFLWSLKLSYLLVSCTETANAIIDSDQSWPVC